MSDKGNQEYAKNVQARVVAFCRLHLLLILVVTTSWLQIMTEGRNWKMPERFFMFRRDQVWNRLQYAKW